MDDLLNRPLIRPIYNDRIFRTMISIPVAFYMMLYRENERWFEALFYLNFWIGVVFSYGTCLLLLWLINRVCYRLDKTYRWRTTTVIRLLYQFSWGFATWINRSMLTPLPESHIRFNLV